MNQVRASRVTVEVMDFGLDLRGLPEDSTLPEDLKIVCAMKITQSCNGYISQKLWTLMMEEFSKNGKRMLSIGKVRHLRRCVRRLR